MRLYRVNASVRVFAALCGSPAAFCVLSGFVLESHRNDFGKFYKMVNIDVATVIANSVVSTHLFVDERRTVRYSMLGKHAW